MKKAVDYINSCYRPTTGGFTYMPSSGAPGFARTAAGLASSSSPANTRTTT